MKKICLLLAVVCLLAMLPSTVFSLGTIQIKQVLDEYGNDTRKFYRAQSLTIVCDVPQGGNLLAALYDGENRLISVAAKGLGEAAQDVELSISTKGVQTQLTLRVFLLETLATAKPLADMQTIEGMAPPDNNSDIYTSDTRLLPVPDEQELQKRFPLMQGGRCVISPSYVAGFGMLAQYGEGGPGEVYIKRTVNERYNSKWMFDPFATVRVLDPLGNVVAFYDFTSDDKTEVILDVPSGPTGVWRVAYNTGQEGDDIIIGLPKTDVWGMRGEMKYGISSISPQTMYLYIPRTTETFNLNTYGNGRPDVALYDEKDALIGQTATTVDGYINTLAVTPGNKDVVYKIVQNMGTGGALMLQSVPGLLCPNIESAKALKGGTVEAEGILVQGPLQQRARSEMLKLKDKDLSVKLNFPTGVPEDLEYPEREIAVYGLYAGFPALQTGLGYQILDHTNPYYGTFSTIGEDVSKRKSFETFQYGSTTATFHSEALSNLATIPTSLNPAYGNQAMIDRAILAAFFKIVSLQGDDLVRENISEYPMTHAFFEYRALACTYYNLKDQLEPEIERVLRQAVIAIGDKIVNFPAYVSNQWGEVINGHLYTYMATGEERFLRYFEHIVPNYMVDQSARTGASFGQHDAGYFIEGKGPDGNYEQLNTHTIVDMYYKYRELPGADQELVVKMRQSIEKETLFQALCWLPMVTSKDITGSSVLSGRVDSIMSGLGYPGIMMAAREFPYAAARPLHIERGNGAGPGATMSHYAVLDRDWQMAILRDGINQKDTGASSGYTSIMGDWDRRVYDAFCLPAIATPATLPAKDKNKVWDLPGIVAINNGAFYGMAYYNGPHIEQWESTTSFRFGFKEPLNSLWSEKTGAVMTAAFAKGDDRVIKSLDNVLHLAVAGTRNNGTVYYSGRENYAMTWIEEGRKYQMYSILYDAPGSITWTCEFADKKVILECTFDLRGSDPINGLFLNIPINASEQGVQIDLGGKALQYRLGGNGMDITSNTTGQPTLGNVVSTSSNVPIQNYRVPMVDGETLRVEFTLK